MKKEKLQVRVQSRVRFSELDPMGIVWHGNYLKYFEDGREAFGREYGFSYLDVYDNGYATPIVETSIKHKAPLTFSDQFWIETTYVNTAAAKIRFDYRLTSEDGVLYAKGFSIQVFLSREENKLELYSPEFYLAWKRKMGVI